MSNKDLQSKYDEMHRKGAGSWFSDGREERETILKIGEPWKRIRVLEIGCGEGDLVREIDNHGGWCYGLDYSAEAIAKAKSRHGEFLGFQVMDYREYKGSFERLVMQGVLEHLDDPFRELQWMIEHFKPKTVITSSPCFLNPRGIVWMTLDMLGAVMSKTDLHFLHPWQFDEFCEKHGYKLTIKDCDWDWGNGHAMIADLRKRIPLALNDGNLPKKSCEKMLTWLSRFQFDVSPGANMVYRIDI